MFDLRIGRAELKGVLVIVRNGKFQQFQSEFFCECELGFEGLLAESPGGETVPHQRSLQSKRTLKQFMPFSD